MTGKHNITVTMLAKLEAALGVRLDAGFAKPDIIPSSNDAVSVEYNSARCRGQDPI